MHLTDKFFSFPPYISTSWENIAALSINSTGHILVHLINSDAVTLPLLSSEETQKIFSAHSSFLEKQVLKEPLHKKERSSAELPIRIGFGAGMDGVPPSLQHNPAQSQGPDLPPEMLAKVSQISKILMPDELQNLPPAEPHCNCPHCQIVRAISGEVRQVMPPIPPSDDDEEISDTELQFQQWDIAQTGDKLFTVTNKLDPQEKYHVFLGEPIGCTCGEANCEHILVVLKS